MNRLHNSVAIEAIYGHIERQKLQLIALSSPEAGTGNSLLSLALAHRAAQSGKQVLLIELNLQNPSLQQHTGTRRRSWSAESEWSDALQKTSCPGLQVLTVPDHAQPHTELKNQDLLNDFLYQAMQLFDLVLCDTAPLLQPQPGNIPAEMICGACQGTLLNVMTSVTTECQIDQSREILQHCSACLAGAIMNDRFAPGLKQELIRETLRLEPVLPRLMAWLREKITQSIVLNQNL